MLFMPATSGLSGKNFQIYLLILGGIALIHILDIAKHFDTVPGIRPGHSWGWTGIVFAPLFHGDYLHLFSNIIPLILMGWIVFMLYDTRSWYVLLIILITSGLGVYILGRHSNHIGASGLVYGQASFLFFSGIFNKNRKFSAISLIIIFMYSGLTEGLLPHNTGISWESHIYGFVGGIGAAWYFRNYHTELSPVESGDEPEESDESRTDEIQNAPVYKVTPDEETK